MPPFVYKKVNIINKRKRTSVEGKIDENREEDN
jgi:hypothetical protein